VDVHFELLVGAHAQHERLVARHAHRAHPALGLAPADVDFDGFRPGGGRRQGASQPHAQEFAAADPKVHSSHPGRTRRPIMKSTFGRLAALLLASLPGLAAAQIHAMFNYETKSADSLKVLKNPVQTGPRKEGIAIIDVDPKSKTFGQTIQDIALPADLVAHHIFYNRDQSKAYVTALGKGELRVMDMKKTPYALKVIAVPDCAVGEDIVFSDDNKKWYLSCMGSDAMIVGDAVADKPLKTIKVAAKYPHGIAIHNGIDRILLSSTVRASDLGDAGESISAVEASTGKVARDLQALEEAVARRRSAGGDPLRAEGGSPDRIHHQHVWRHDVDRDLEQGEKGFRRRPGTRLQRTEDRSSPRDLLQRQGRSDVCDHGEARTPAHLRHRQGGPAEVAQVDRHRGRRAPRRLHEGRALRLRAERVAEPSGDERWLRDDRGPQAGKGHRQHGRAEGQRAESQQHGAVAEVE
jgi:hypothetical protein